MHSMLPVNLSETGSLADVLKSCFQAALGQPNAFELPQTKSTILILVDGLGDELLSYYRGHARALWQYRSRQIGTVWPTTTAAALTSLATGVFPGEHGIISYQLYQRQSGRILNQLSDWGEDMLTTKWQLCPPLYQQYAKSVASFIVSNPKYADTGFTKATLAGSTDASALTIQDRFKQAAKLAAEPALIFLYISELDAFGHNRGIGSDKWLNALETIDSEFRKLIELTKNLDCGIVLTADHGGVNIPKQNQIILPENDELILSAVAVAGEPRAMMIYLDENATFKDRLALQQLWQARFDYAAWILTKEECLAHKIYGRVSVSAANRLADLLVFAKADYAFYSAADLSGTGMIGQHGSITIAEQAIPLVLANKFSK